MHSVKQLGTARSASSQGVWGSHQPVWTTHRLSHRGNRQCSGKLSAMHTKALQFPITLPVFPVMPQGVFVPGMTKTLYLYEDHFKQMLEAGVASNNLMAISVMEPYLGKPEQAATLGSYVGGSNCVFSCACLVKILDVKPYTGGYLVRIRGEARLGVSSVLQVHPFLIAQLYNLPDCLPTRQEQQSLPAAVDRLDEVMRSVQLLASKFRCDETACIQQAFRYVNEVPLVPNIQEPLPALSDGADQGLPAQQPAVVPVHASTTGEEDQEREQLDLQRASRLSYASLQLLPESTPEERMEVVRGRLLAMESISLSERLDIVTQIMSAACASLSAKCALMSMPRR